MDSRALVLMFCFVGVVIASKYPCPCNHTSQCEPVKIQYGHEVFIFAVRSDANWRMYDWDKITTIAIFGDKHDSQIMCYAHSVNTRIVFTNSFPVGNLTNPDQRSAWIKLQVDTLLKLHYDGINVDFEDVIYPDKSNDTIRKGLSLLMNELSTAAKAAVPHAQITFDVAWSPDGIDVRSYDYRALADACDMLFIMAYDERSQITGSCMAWANSAFNNTMYGVKKYMQLGIAPDKLILGLPWYGYLYPCINLTKDNTCYLKEVPFRGAPCSDAAGSEIDFYEIGHNYLPESTSGRKWDNVSLSPYFNYKNKKSGEMEQIWYDDVQSLTIKYHAAMMADLRGVGAWTVDSIDYTNTTAGAKQRAGMFGALPDLKRVAPKHTNDIF